MGLSFIILQLSPNILIYAVDSSNLTNYNIRSNSYLVVIRFGFSVFSIFLRLSHCITSKVWDYIEWIKKVRT